MNAFCTGFAEGQTWIEIQPDTNKASASELIEGRKTRYFSLIDEANKPLVSLRVAADFSSAWQGRLMVVAFGNSNPNPFIDHHIAIRALGARLGIEITLEAYPYWDKQSLAVFGASSPRMKSTPSKPSSIPRDVV